MRTILFILFFYLFYRILRRLIMGPRPRRTFYVNFGRGGPFGQQQPGSGPFGQASSGSDPYGRTTNGNAYSDEPMVGGRPQQQRRVDDKKQVQDIQDAEFKEIE